MKRCRLLLLSLLGCSSCNAFQIPVAPLFHSTTTSLSRSRHDDDDALGSSALFAVNKKKGDSSFVRRLLDTTTDLPSHYPSIHHSGLFGPVKKVHNPITYFCLGLMAGFRWDWCFRSPLYWFVLAFTVKWYRARYVFKIPVWDRQPNWNNVITSQEQEKDLKALTCKNCGSTIFIAKTREFFFEGTTGIGGLGCFACGAKGKDNFVMDRERILEDVGDMDDYFEYERPLDLVSRAERRKLLKEAKGDEEKANELAQQQTHAEGGVLDAEIINTPSDNDDDAPGKVNGDAAPKTGQVMKDEAHDGGETTMESSEPPKKRKKKKKKVTQKKTIFDSKKKSSIAPKPSSADLDDLDVLDMDAW